MAFEGVTIEWHPDDAMDDDDGGDDDDDGDEEDVDDGTGFKADKQVGPRWRGFTKQPAKIAAEKVTPEQVAEVVNLAKDLDAWNQFEAPSVAEGEE